MSRSAFRAAVAEAMALGFKLSLRDGEYRLAPAIGNRAKAERRAYYTDDIDDALGTARLEAMRFARRHKLNKPERGRADESL
jgi:hypothetical protein